MDNAKQRKRQRRVGNVEEFGTKRNVRKCSKNKWGLKMKWNESFSIEVRVGRKLNAICYWFVDPRMRLCVQITRKIRRNLLKVNYAEWMLCCVWACSYVFFHLFSFVLWICYKMLIIIHAEYQSGTCAFCVLHNIDSTI